MKPSAYNLSFQHNEVYYLYNILSTAMVEIPRLLLDKLESGDLDDIENDDLCSMLELHFIVDDDADEALEYLFYYDSSRYQSSSDVFNLTLIPTYGCNLCCPYCYQGSGKAPSIISQDSLDAISRFVENEIKPSSDRNDIKRLNINLFGGEPLIAKKEVIGFCQTMENLAKKYNCVPGFSLVSNYTLVDEDVIAMIKRHNMDVQVTFDGDKALHDSRRIRKDGTGTFELILDNIRKSCEHGLKDNIQVRINVDEKNIDSVDDVFELVHPYARTAYMAFLQGFEGKNDSFRSCISETAYSKMIVDKIAPISKRHGFPIMRPFGKRSPCSINRVNTYFVDLNLNVYKCDLMIGYPHGKSGTIDNSGSFHPSPAFYRQMSHSPAVFEKCRNCMLLPACGGGCPVKEYVRNKRDDGHFHYNCEVTKDGLITLLKGYIDSLYE